VFYIPLLLLPLTNSEFIDVSEIIFSHKKIAYVNELSKVSLQYILSVYFERCTFYILPISY
jgi:hypothetical protein